VYSSYISLKSLANRNREFLKKRRVVQGSFERISMEFFDNSPVQLNAIRRIDPEYEEPTDPNEPKADKYGFTAGVTKTVA
jgi:flagellar basal body rod protein FlgC